jgi:hypothetical protein
MAGDGRQPFTVRCPDAGCAIPASSRENAVIISDRHSVKHDHAPTIEHDGGGA